MPVHELRLSFARDVASVREGLEAIGWHRQAARVEEDSDGIPCLDLKIEAPYLHDVIRWVCERIHVDERLSTHSITAFDDEVPSDGMYVIQRTGDVSYLALDDPSAASGTPPERP